MKSFEKSVIGVVFSLLFFIALILGTLYFQILNSSYLFNTLEKHQVYNKLPYLLANSIPNDPNLSFEERFALTAIVSNIPPNVYREIVETNLTQVLNFAHAKSDNIEIIIPAKKLKLNPVDIKWSLSENANPTLREQLKILHGAAPKILILLALSLLGMAGLFLLYARFDNSKYIIGGYVLLLTNGIALLLTSTIFRFFLVHMAGDLPSQPEPAQKLLGLLAGSLFLEIVTSWIIIGTMVTITGCALFIADKKLLK